MFLIFFFKERFPKMTSAKIARAYNKKLQQNKRQQRINSPFQQFMKFVKSHKSFDNCFTFRGIALAKEMLKTNKNVKQVVYKVDEIVCDEMYEMHLSINDSDYYY